jgi:hypothetical protein
MYYLTEQFVLQIKQVLTKLEEQRKGINPFSCSYLL